MVDEGGNPRKDLDEKLWGAGLERALLDSSVKRGYNPLVVITKPVKYIFGYLSKFFKPYGYLGK